jgi:baculoviral IAP repeat-containing protein 6
MQPMQYTMYEFTNNNVYSTFTTDNIKQVKLSKEALMRLSKEYSSLKSSLPLNETSSAWLKIDKNFMHYNKFLISGPKDTPYENGLFLFNTLFPADYPNSAPTVLLETTNSGNYRFNPNLYACGKVCLSLLGTWSGSGGEEWNMNTSTFLQVIVSIQSLILVDDPYFNEPGYESIMNTESGNNKSFDYSDDRRLHTIIIAMTNNIKNPPPGFENIVKNHFKYKKDSILLQVDKWMTESKQRHSKYENAIKDLKIELDKL